MYIDEFKTRYIFNKVQVVTEYILSITISSFRKKEKKSYSKAQKTVTLKLYFKYIVH